MTSPKATSTTWLSLIAICAVTVLVWVTASDISLALPTIGRELGGSMDTLQWAVNGYFLAGSLIIVGGKLGDIFGRRLIFAIGTLLILIGSVVAGLATDPTQLIIGRLIEGVGAAAILPAAGMDVMATVTQAFDAAVAYAMLPSLLTAVIGVGIAVVLLRCRAPAADEM